MIQQHSRCCAFYRDRLAAWPGGLTSSGPTSQSPHEPRAQSERASHGGACDSPAWEINRCPNYPSSRRRGAAGFENLARGPVLVHFLRFAVLKAAEGERPGCSSRTPNGNLRHAPRSNQAAGAVRAVPTFFSWSSALFCDISEVLHRKTIWFYFSGHKPENTNLRYRSRNHEYIFCRG